jgi:hypothetical protein
MEEHGQWDEGSECLHFTVSSMNPEEGMPYEDAHALYSAAKQRLAKLGFIYSSVADYRRKAAREYRLLETESVSA